MASGSASRWALVFFVGTSVDPPHPAAEQRRRGVSWHFGRNLTEMPSFTQSVTQWESSFPRSSGHVGIGCSTHVVSSQSSRWFSSPLPPRRATPMIQALSVCPGKPCLCLCSCSPGTERMLSCQWHLLCDPITNQHLLSACCVPGTHGALYVHDLILVTPYEGSWGIGVQVPPLTRCVTLGK